MNSQTHEKLCDALSLRGGPAPAIKCKEFYALLDGLFTQEEAEVAIKLPIEPIPIDKASELLNRDQKNTLDIVERMANEGLLFSHEKNGITHYSLMPLIPGIFEMQFTKGEVNDHTKKLARLFDEYFNVLWPYMESNASQRAVFPFARVITVEQEIPSGVEIFPYDKLSEYIAKSEDIAVCICYCRHHGELVGKPCSKSKDVCMVFGTQARYVIKRGFGKPASKEEALHILDRAEKEGLIHCSSNTSKYITFICNCCLCHCGILQSIQRSASPSMAANSSFIVMVDQDECTGCGICLDRCQMEALKINGSIIIRDAERCIGCGLCVSECPTGALSLVKREDAATPPVNERELMSSIIHSVLS